MKKQMNFKEFMRTQVDFAAYMLAKTAKELTSKTEDAKTITSYVYMSRKVDVIKLNGTCIEIKSGNISLTR